MLRTLATYPLRAERPNIVFIFSDDHAQHAISAYGSKVNETLHIDRLAAAGARFTNSFVTNSICTPSRTAASNVLGRDHSSHCITLWMAYGRVKVGYDYGPADEPGFTIAEKLLYRFQGHDYRLTDVHGHVVGICWRERLRHANQIRESPRQSWGSPH